MTTNPQPGDVVQFDIGHGRNPKSGHVAFMGRDRKMITTTGGAN